MTQLIIDGIRIPIDRGEDEALSAAEKKLRSAGVPFEKGTLHIYKRSVDARRKDSIHFVYSVSARTEASADSIKSTGIRAVGCEREKTVRGNEKMNGRPFVVGFGPAGMFCALMLAEYGMRPVVLERCACVEERVRKVGRFYETGSLDTDTNIQFGAGGAGTFSDGKLITRIGDSRTSYVLDKLYEMGAPEDITRVAKPHIGTDILRDVVKNFARRIEELGGEIRYGAKVDGIGDGWLSVNGEKLSCGCAVLAPGHSARDTYAKLISDGWAIEAKPFSVGVRIEHLQKELDRAMYGDESLSERLGHAEYQLSHRKGERGVYTFCMCPGGEVVAAASEEGGVVTNGMSRRKRNSGIANSAVAVSVLPEDFGGSPKGAIAFQRALEAKAFMAGGGDFGAPCQTVGGFYDGRIGDITSKFTPTYMNGRVTPADLGRILPPFVSSMLKEGLSCFGMKIKGFSDKDVPLTGVETRTSAPIRILRDKNTMCAVGHSLVYPCGEGAGYAGGITSAAVDGMRAAEAILSRFAPSGGSD